MDAAAGNWTPPKPIVGQPCAWVVLDLVTGQQITKVLFVKLSQIIAGID